MASELQQAEAAEEMLAAISTVCVCACVCVFVHG